MNSQPCTHPTLTDKLIPFKIVPDSYIELPPAYLSGEAIAFTASNARWNASAITELDPQTPGNEVSFLAEYRNRSG
jgi:hypothetical protein